MARWSHLEADRGLLLFYLSAEKRRGSESNAVFPDCQPQYPDLQGYFNSDFTGVQALFGTIRHVPDLTRHLPAAYSVIEEIVEGFVEGFYRSWHTPTSSF